MRMLTPYWTTRRFPMDLFEEMDRFFDGFQTKSPATYEEKAFDPACDIVEGEDHFLMSVDLPGLKKEDIKIEITGNTLSVSGERKRESQPDKNQKIQRYEKSYGFFKRSFTLPTSVDTNKVEASYEHGVLELKLPKIPAAQPRQIEIQSSERLLK